MAGEPAASPPACPGPIPWAATPGRQAFAVLLAAAALLLAFLGRRELSNPDEPRDAEIAREYAAGLWTVAPEINGVPFQERPPLFYWMVSASFRLHGEPSDASAKAASALLGVLAVLATWLLGESLIGAGRGWLPALMLLGTPYFFLKFRICVTDAGLTAFTTLSLALFFAAHRRGSWPLAAGAGVAAGLAFLCKGLIGLGVPAVVAGAWLAARRDLGAVLRLRLWLAVLLGLGVVLPWVWALHGAKGPDGLRQFFLVQNLGRVGADADHAKPFWAYVCVIWTALPHTPLLLAGLLPGNRRDGPGREGFLAGALWGGSLLLVLSCIGGKRPIYLLPLLPGAALAGAAVVEAAAAGGLAPAWERATRAWVRFLEALTLQFLLPGGRDLRVRAGAAALGMAALTLFADAVVLARGNARNSGYAMAARAAEAAGARPLVLFRVGEGDIGQFAFALRRRLPVAWTEDSLRAMLGEGPSILLVEE